MSEITDWEPLSKPEIDWEAQYERQLKINEVLIFQKQDLFNHIDKIEKDYEHAKTMMREAANSLRVNQSDYDAYKESSQKKFRILKAEITTSLRAINLCLLASLNTEKQQLTHRARNFRMRHINQIISNEIDRFGDRQLISYEDDF